jgi:hypothetical protein
MQPLHSLTRYWLSGAIFVFLMGYTFAFHGDGAVRILGAALIAVAAGLGYGAFYLQRRYASSVPYTGGFRAWVLTVLFIAAALWVFGVLSFVEITRRAHAQPRPRVPEERVSKP